MADTIMWSKSKQVNTNLVIKLNGGSTEGTNLFTYNGSSAKTINVTPSSIGAINTAGTGLSKSGTTLNHSNSVAAAKRGPTATATINPGNSFVIPYIAHDAQGHITVSAGYTHTLSSNILDTGDIVTALSSSTSNSKVPGAKLFSDCIASLNNRYNFSIDTGTVVVNVPANGSADIDVNFNIKFLQTPIIMTTLNGTSYSQFVCCINDAYAESCTLRLLSTRTSAVNQATIRWYAVGRI